MTTKPTRENVIPFPRERRKPARPIPDRLEPRERREVLAWAARCGFCFEEVRYAVQMVRDWARSRAKEPHKRDWVATIRNAMRDGWALKGYREAQLRQGRTKRTPITADLIRKQGDG